MKYFKLSCRLDGRTEIQNWGISHKRPLLTHNPDTWTRLSTTKSDARKWHGIICHSLRLQKNRFWSKGSNLKPTFSVSLSFAKWLNSCMIPIQSFLPLLGLGAPTTRVAHRSFQCIRGSNLGHGLYLWPRCLCFVNPHDQKYELQAMHKGSKCSLHARCGAGHVPDILYLLFKERANFCKNRGCRCLQQWETICDYCRSIDHCFGALSPA